MREKIDVPVTVTMCFDHKTRVVKPVEVVWEGREYGVSKVGMHHTYRRGRTLCHVFSVVAQSMFFRLVLDSENLHWRLEEVSDGVAF